MTGASWQQLADTLGFRDEEEMLKHLYITQEFSLDQLHSILGFCTFTIRRRLIKYGVPLRGRGGPNSRLGRRRLKHVSDEELANTPAIQLAIKYQVHTSTVYSELRLRESEVRAACLHERNKE